MAGYREHIGVSGLLGVAYGTSASLLMGFTPVQGALAAGFTWVSGMLPDLDSESGRPVRELFGLLGAILPMMLMRRLLAWSGDDVELAMLIAFSIYGVVRFGGPLLLGAVSVHRGMFHSVPALLIACECTFLAFKADSLDVRLLMAGGVGVGFLSHLILDEVYSVEWTGIRLKLNSAAGSAVKFIGRNLIPNVVCYSLLAALTFATLADVGLIENRLRKPNLLRQAVETIPPRG